MARHIQISASVSKATRDQLEQYSRATGVKKGYIIEQALKHHLQALSEFPPDVVVPTTLVITPASWKAARKQMRSGKPPTALRKLMRDGD